MVRLRFAPSPTGFLHIGSLRTALYNYLFARKNGGKLILRVEDTDRTCLVEGGMEEQIESLRWAGVEFDEGPHIGGDHGPYIQSERFDLYREYGMKLVDTGHAYYAFDTSEELDAMRKRQQDAGLAPKYDRSSMRNQFTLGDAETQRLLEAKADHVIRLKVPQHEDLRFHDEVRGDVIIKGHEIDDQVLLKSDGFPTYHLANVVDDHLMEITHVVRAEEWLPSTPKHVVLYNAFGWQAPVFAHVPLLLNPDRSKMSKRFGDVMVRDYRAKGYFPEALVNYVALCGWNPGTEQEIFSMEELVEAFSLERVHKAGAVFDHAKLDWVQHQYMKARDPHESARDLRPLLVERGYAYVDPDYVAKVITLLKERTTFLKDLVDFADYFFSDTLSSDEDELLASFKGDEALQQALMAMRDGLNAEVLASTDAFKELTKHATSSAGLKMGQFLKPLRVIITHRTVGAELFDTMHLLGEDRCKQRINAFLG
jgi:glutamyl-tRNA synthetase